MIQKSRERSDYPRWANFFLAEEMLHVHTKKSLKVDWEEFNFPEN